MKIALFFFADPRRAPPTMNAALHLANLGHEVDVIGIHEPEVTGEVPTHERIRWIYRGRASRRVGRIVQLLRFSLGGGIAGLRRRYDRVIAYDILAVSAGRLAAWASRGRWIYHNHDLQLLSETKGWFRLAKRAELSGARQAAAVVFPQRERFELFEEEARATLHGFIVHNSPLREWSRHAARPSDDVARFKRSVGMVAVYQGGLGRLRGTMQLLESLRQWRDVGGLVLVGRSLEEGFDDVMDAFVEEHGLRDSLLRIPEVSYWDLPAITSQCDVGVGVLTTAEINPCVNLRFLAGASNKLFEYMACGLPVVVPQSDDTEALVIGPGYGTGCDPNDPGSIAAAIKSLMQDQAEYGRLAECCKRDFASKWHFEKQFEPVRKFLETGV